MSALNKIGTCLKGATLAAMLAVAPDFALGEEEPSTCLAVAELHPGATIWRAAQHLPAENSVRIRYVGHSAFRIESAGGVSIVTDFSGYWGAGDAPTAVTMNHAHATHFTISPDPSIEYVLRGWNPEGGEPADHHLRIDDVYIRNVTTDLYSSGVLIEENGNSIFVFEIAGLCIGHLGHLHHKLSPGHIANLGRLDVVFMPVDGTYTMSQEGMIELAHQLRASVIIPMHYFSLYSLQRFLAGMAGEFSIETVDQPFIDLSLRTLPERPVVHVLSPY